MNHPLHSPAWGKPGDAFSTPGSVLVKLRLGDAPDRLPAAMDVRVGALRPAPTFGIDRVDRVLAHFSGDRQIYHVHTAAANLRGAPGVPQRFNDLEQAYGLSRTFEIDFEDECPVGAMVDALRALSVVEYASPHYLARAPFAAAPAAPAAVDPGTAWVPREMVHAAEALAYEPGDPAVIVAIVDTGVMVEHPEMGGRPRRGYDTVQLISTDLPSGVRLLRDESRGFGDPVDLVGHGTSCAGIIGASGEQIPPGLAGQCSLLPIRVLGSAQYPGRKEPVGIGAIADIDCGLKMAVDLGAKVLNLSFGTPETEAEATGAPPHQDVVQYALSHGCILIAASGNSGKAENFSPASLEGVMAVSAVDMKERPCAFNTSGPHVAVSAPGERVVSSSLHGYSQVTGTSFAAPFVTAAAALLVSRAARRAYPIDGGDVARLVRGSARPWAQGLGEGCGTGILDAVAALRALDSDIDRSMAEGANRRRRESGNGG